MPRVRSDRVYPTTYPITLVTDVEIPEYLPEHGLGQRAIPGYLPEESNYSRVANPGGQVSISSRGANLMLILPLIFLFTIV
eukprot:scaffold10389_cov78-Cyclotella_meneghiniana.AAC.6